jgi:hypothetical protein
MAETKISDVIVPEIFTRYVIERTAEKSELWQSGIVQRDAQFDALANDGGKTITMPFWQDLAGDDEVLDDSTPLTPGKIQASADAAAHHNRGKAWSTNDLAGVLAGSDPMNAIVNLVADYWVRRMQVFLLATLRGIFTSTALAASNSLDIHATVGSATSANFLTGTSFIDACQKLGDAKSKLVAVAMHSAVEASLLKLDLIDFLPDSTGKLTLKSFMGLRVIVDDGMTVETVNALPVYSTYLFGQGAIAHGESNKPRPIDGGFGDWYTEMGRAILAGTNYLVNRRRFILHPRGVKWTDTNVVGVSPTNLELQDGDNWQRVYEAKNVRIVRIRHNIPTV